MQSVVDRVRNFIIDDLNWDGPANELTDDLRLIQAGVLDSLGTLMLVEFLESNYGITINDSEILPANLDSLASIERYVKSKSPEPRPRSGDYGSATPKVS